MLVGKGTSDKEATLPGSEEDGGPEVASTTRAGTMQTDPVLDYIKTNAEALMAMSRSLDALTTRINDVLQLSTGRNAMLDRAAMYLDALAKLEAERFLHSKQVAAEEREDRQSRWSDVKEACAKLWANPLFSMGISLVLILFALGAVLWITTLLGVDTGELKYWIGLSREGQ